MAGVLDGDGEDAVQLGVAHHRGPEAAVRQREDADAVPEVVAEVARADRRVGKVVCGKESLALTKPRPSPLAKLKKNGIDQERGRK